MEQDSQTQGLIKWMLGVAGLGAVAAPLGVPKYGIWISLAIVLLLAALVGGYWFWQNRKQKREQRQFANALQQESAAAPRGISDPDSHPPTIEPTLAPV